MKNNYCDLDEDVIRNLPSKYIGFLSSPFQHNLQDGFILIPEDVFKEIIDIIADVAVREVGE